jgi:hypothetical protein
VNAITNGTASLATLKNDDQDSEATSDGENQ